MKSEVEKMDVSQENERKSPEVKKHFKGERERRENLIKKVERREKKGSVPLKMHHNHGMESDKDEDFLQSKNNHKKSRTVSNEGPKTNSDICKGNGTKRVSGKKLQSCPTSSSRDTKSECDGQTLFNINSLQVNKKAENETDLFAGVHKRGPCDEKQKCIKTKDQAAHTKNSKNLKSTKVTNEDPELPSMSFETCLSYDFKALKRKKSSGHREKPAKKHNTCEKEEGPVKVPIMKLSNVPIMKLSNVFEGKNGTLKSI